MIKFGTSGFRGIMSDNFTKQNVCRVAAALLEIIKKSKTENAKIVIGYDNRFMSRDFAQWVAQVLCLKTEVVMFDQSVPTPTVAWFAKQYTFGIMITASHNPYIYNGIKLFLHGGKECDDVFARQIETLANKIEYCNIQFADFDLAIKNKKIMLTNDYQSYCNSILKHIDCKAIQKSKLKVLANCMHGNSADCLKYLFKKLNVNYTLQNPNADPYFANIVPAPYVHNLKGQSNDVKKGGYDAGLALDADSDRFTLISKNGTIYDCNYLLSVLYYYYLTKRNFKGSVVKNVALSNLVKKISDHFGYQCYDAKVGFKNIAPLLEKTDAFIAAESNGLAFKNHLLSKDGIFAAVALLELLAVMQKPFDKLFEDLQTKFKFKSVFLEKAYPITDKKKIEIHNLLFEKKNYPNFNNSKITDIYDEEGLKISYPNGYWGMIRFSGNEPIVRIFCEMETQKECHKLFACYEKFLGL